MEVGRAEKLTKKERSRCQRADERLASNMTLYKQRQMIVEHLLRTIKRTYGYMHFLLRGLEKARGEAVMH